MELNGDTDVLLESLCKGSSSERSKERSHILDTDGISALCFALLCVVYIVIIGENIAQCKGHCYLSVCALLLGSVDSCLEVSDIVQRIKDTDNIHTVCNSLLNEIFKNIVSIVTVAQHILTSEKHLELGVGHILTDYSQSLPGILVEETDTSIKCCAAPDLCGIIADLIHLLHNGEHLVNAHSCCDERLMSVSENGFGDFYFRHCGSLLSAYAMVARTSSELTVSPFLAAIDVILPATGATISFSILSASRTTTT